MQAPTKKVLDILTTYPSYPLPGTRVKLHIRHQRTLVPLKMNSYWRKWSPIIWRPTSSMTWSNIRLFRNWALIYTLLKRKREEIRTKILKDSDQLPRKGSSKRGPHSITSDRAVWVFKTIIWNSQAHKLKTASQSPKHSTYHHIRHNPLLWILRKVRRPQLFHHSSNLISILRLFTPKILRLPLLSVNLIKTQKLKA